MDNLKIGKFIRYFGWAVTVYYACTYTYGTYEILKDPSVSVYAMLVVFEGLVFVAGGLFLVWLGRRISANAEAAATTIDNKNEL